MAARKKSTKRTWQESYPSLILGAIVVIVLGLLVANFITRKNEDIGDGKKVDMTQQQANQEKQYKVAANDSLSKISEKFYGDQELWPVLARVNSISNPNIIFVDSTLEIPVKTQAEELKSQMSQTTYKVESGDTLFIIAEKMYGDGSKWVLLDRANNVGRLPNGNPLIFAGSTITVPR